MSVAGDQAAIHSAAAHWRRRALLAGTALALLTLAPGGPARAVDGTWLPSPPSDDFNTGTNWSSSPDVPDGTASFGASSTTSIAFSASTTVGGLTLNVGAAAYQFAHPSGGDLIFNGAGIVINGGSLRLETNNSSNITFSNSSTAGSATLVLNNGVVQFNTSSTAGSANFTLGNGTVLNFIDASTAGSASFTLAQTVQITFFNTSSASTASFTLGPNGLLSSNTLLFRHSSNASSASFTLNGSSSVSFVETSAAGSATFTLNSSAFLVFNNSSTADRSEEHTSELQSQR